MRQFFVGAGSTLVLLSCLVVSRADAQGCTFEDKGYFDGQSVCQYGTLMKCVGSSWVDTGSECSNTDVEENVQQPGVAGPGNVQMPAQPQAPAEPAVPPVSE
jgi:hypothetical protein